MKVFLIGSAPYAPQWWEQHKHRVEVAHCINNAKAIVGDHAGTWYISTDFLIHNDYSFESLKQRSRQDWHYCPIVSEPLLHPRGYSCQYHGTMVVNACYDILNRALLAGETVKLNLVGCDLDYSGEETHFYEGGTPDPMRIPQDILIGHLTKLRDDFPEHRIVTLGPPSILPFMQGDPEFLWTPTSSPQAPQATTA
jgi:hypothetical protein